MTNNKEINVNGQYSALTGHSVQAAICYTIPNADCGHEALIGSGTNGGLAGKDVCVLDTDPITMVDVTGVTHGVLESMPIVQCATLINTVDEAKILLIISQNAECTDRKMIYSKNQHFGCQVFDMAKCHGGQQALYTPEGYSIPLHICNGLFYIDMAAPMDDDLEQYPHTFIMADSEWDPVIVDDEYIYNDDDDPLLLHLHNGCDSYVDANRDHTLNTYVLLHYDSDSDTSHNPQLACTKHELLLNTLTLPLQDLKCHLPDMDAIHTTDDIHAMLKTTSQHSQANKCYLF